MPGGIVLDADIRITWDECIDALAGRDPESVQGRRRLASWLTICCLLARSSPATRAERIRPLGLPVGHALHPGPGWGRRVLGGVLDLGLGVVGLDPAHPEDVTPLPPGIWTVLGVDPETYWPGVADYLAAMASLATERRLRAPYDPLRPMGDCDVITLLCHREYRTALVGAAGAPGEMTAAGVPMRTRGWTQLRRIDPAFLVAAAAATDEGQRGFARPLLITADEVVMVSAGGRPGTNALLDAAPDPPWLRSVRYR